MEDIKQKFLKWVVGNTEYGLLYEYITDDGDGIFQLNEDGEGVADFVEQELDKAKEEGRKEVLNGETFVGDYDALAHGLHVRTVNRENFLAQIYKTIRERYDWAFGNATYKQALKMIENSLASTLTPYVGVDRMVDEARIEVLSKLTTK